MVQKIQVTRNKAGLEDLLFGVGTVEQTRGGQTVSVTKINAANLPFDETATLAETMTELAAAKALLDSYGTTLDTLAANIAHLLTIEQVEIYGSGGDAATLQGSTLAQTRANINATQLESNTLAQVRANINATQLEGNTLAQVRANINATQLEGNTLAQVKANINAVTLEGSTLAQVRTGINAATLDGNTLAQVRAGIDATTLDGHSYSAVVSAATVGDASSITSGKVRFATDAEAKAATTTGVVLDPVQAAMLPLMPVAWVPFTVTSTGAVTLGTGVGVSSGSCNLNNVPLSFTLSKQVASGFGMLVNLASPQTTMTTLGYTGQTVAHSQTPAATSPADFYVPARQVFATISSSSTVNFGNLANGYSFSGISGNLLTGILIVFGTKS